MYMIATLVIRFVFEKPFDLRVVLDFFWSWFFLRFFMRAKNGRVGDLSPEFALSQFFP